MLYDTLSQPLFVLTLLGTGFLAGFFFDIKTILLTKAKHKKILSNILDFICVTLTLLSLFLTNLFCHYGIIRLFPALVFFSAFALQRFLMKKIFANFLAKCYTYFRRKNHGAEKP